MSHADDPFAKRPWLQPDSSDTPRTRCFLEEASLVRVYSSAVITYQQGQTIAHTFLELGPLEPIIKTSAFHPSRFQFNGTSLDEIRRHSHSEALLWKSLFPFLIGGVTTDYSIASQILPALDNFLRDQRPFQKHPNYCERPIL